MHNPVGYGIEGDRLIMANPAKWPSIPTCGINFPHVVTAGITTAGFLYLSFSAWHLLQKNPERKDFFTCSFRLAAIFAFTGAVLVGLIGHAQGQYLPRSNPSRSWPWRPLGNRTTRVFSVVALIDQENQENPFDLKIPYALSFLLYNDFSSEVKGIIDLQAEAEAQYGPGDYIPPGDHFILVAAGDDRVRTVDDPAFRPALWWSIRTSWTNEPGCCGY